MNAKMMQHTKCSYIPKLNQHGGKEQIFPLKRADETFWSNCK